jgi:hypothetical protein
MVGKTRKKYAHVHFENRSLLVIVAIQRLKCMSRLAFHAARGTIEGMFQPDGLLKRTPDAARKGRRAFNFIYVPPYNRTDLRW